MASRADDFEFRNELAATLENERLADQIVERLPMVPVENLATVDRPTLPLLTLRFGCTVSTGRWTT